MLTLLDIKSFSLSLFTDYHLVQAWTNPVIPGVLGPLLTDKTIDINFGFAKDQLNPYERKNVTTSKLTL